MRCGPDGVDRPEPAPCLRIVSLRQRPTTWVSVGNGQRRYHFFGQSWTSPKTVSFGEVVPAEWLGNVARRFMLEGSDSYEG
jgi:hypothetical protein